MFKTKQKQLLQASPCKKERVLLRPKQKSPKAYKTAKKYMPQTKQFQQPVTTAADCGSCFLGICELLQGELKKVTKKSKYIVKGLNLLCRGLGIQLSNFSDLQIRKGLNRAKSFSWDKGTPKNPRLKLYKSIHTS